MFFSQCKTDYIAIYRGSSSNSAHLVTLCANEQKQLDYPGPKLLIEFRQVQVLIIIAASVNDLVV